MEQYRNSPVNEAQVLADLVQDTSASLGRPRILPSGTSWDLPGHQPNENQQGLIFTVYKYE